MSYPPKPTKCHYTSHCIDKYAGFEIKTIGSGCIDCDLTDSKDCPYRITQIEWNKLAAVQDNYHLIAHCNL